MPDDQWLVRYLLGLLPEKETQFLDEQSIADEHLADRLSVVEDDLVDAYARGWLDGEILERFESFYLASPRRRDRVQFAQRFVAAVDRLQVREPAEPQAPERPDEASRAPATSDLHPQAEPQRRFSLVFTVAAGLLLFLTCGVLFVQNVSLRKVLAGAERDARSRENLTQALAGELGAQRAASDAALKELDRTRAAQPRAAIALVLLPETRAAGPVSTIAIPRGTVAVTFDLRLDSKDFAHYRAALKDPATNQIVWRSAPLAPEALRSTPTIAVVVPANVLKAQHYSLELSGGRSPGAFEIVGTYVFRTESR